MSVNPCVGASAFTRIGSAAAGRRGRAAFTLVELPAVNRREREAFTLVELLVVIGIIALLISILLPSLNKARQQATLLSCQANLRSIGGLLQIYVTDNRGVTPPLSDRVNYTHFADTLTLLAQKPARYATTPFPGQPATAVNYEPPAVSRVFQDLDTPSENWFPHATAYVGNVRALGLTGQTGGSAVWDPLTGNSADGWKQRKYGSLKRAAAVMLMWCGPVEVNGDTNYGVYYTFPNSLDNYGMYGGHGMCYPNPVQSSFQTAWYDNPISLGCPVGVGGSPSSQSAGSVTMSYLNAANRDYTASGTYNGLGGFDSCNMRFRHMNNTTANFLFADGHVESRKLGQVFAKDICVNPR